MLMTFIITLLVLAFILLLIKMIWRKIKVKHLLDIYGFETNQNSFEDINKEYYHVIEKDMNEQTIYDVELHHVFDTINRTYTEIGREYLYGQFFVREHDYHLLEYVIEKIGHQNILKKVIYELFELSHHYYQSLTMFQNQNVLKWYDMMISGVLGIIPIFFIIGYFIYGTSIIQFMVLWCCIQVIMHEHYMKKTNNMMKQVYAYCHVVKTVKVFHKLKLYDEKTSLKISQMIKKANQYTRIFRLCMKIEKYDIYYLMELLYTLFPISLFQSYILQKHMKELKEEYIKIYEYVGMVELSLAISSLRNQYETCIPHQSSKPQLSFQNIYHPILKNPVKNSLILDASCMITGSNASGKSTFLKTIGFNILMAKVMHTCFAEEIIYYPYHLCTSIHMKDHIDDGESYYIKEIKVLKYITECVKKEPCLVLIDEILKGTNEKERLIIAKSVLQYLFTQQSLIIITTHDITLAEYFQKMSQYSFHDYIENHQLKSDYLLKKGICYVGNAISLLDVYHFDKEILKQLQ